MKEFDVNVLCFPNGRRTVSIAPFNNRSKLLPIGASGIRQPAVGMKATNERGTSRAIVPIRNAVIICTTLARFGTRRNHFIKPQLRSQNMLIALLSVPSHIVSFAIKIIHTGTFSSVHRIH